MYRQEHPPGLEYVHMQKHWEAMSDEALAAAALQAEDRAFTVLVARLLPPLRAMAESYRLPGLDRDDLVQEGFLGVMSAVRHYHPDLGEFTPYALTCARNSMGSAAPFRSAPAAAGLRPHSGGPSRRGGDPAAGAGGGRRIQRRTAPLDANRAYRLRAPSVPAVFGRLPLFGNSLSSFFSFQSCG